MSWKQNDSEKFIDLMEIASSQVFVYLSRWNLDDIRVKKDYILCLIIVDLANAVEGEDVKHLQIKTKPILHNI